MRAARLLIATLATTGLVTTTAHAAYYINKPLAESDARRVLHSYGYTHTGVYCRPKSGANEHATKNGRTLYHKWSCGFYVGEPGASCKGLMSIYGSDSGVGFLYYRHGSVGESC